MTRPRLIAGIMSGTSVDAIDVALVAFDALDAPTLLTAAEYPFDPELRVAILAVAEPGGGDTRTIAHVHATLAAANADAVARTMASAANGHELDAIGCHGQTVAHWPADVPATTLQLGSGTMLAALTGVPVVYDFRSADVALGGQGAPLIPFVDFQLFHHLAVDESICVLNLGGIANLTVLPKGCFSPTEVIAFDTGPANMVIDGIAQRLLGMPFDRAGIIAADGEVEHDLLSELLAHDYFARKPPKSTGREQFGAAFIERVIEGGRRRSLTAADMLATASALTVASIASALSALPATHQPRRIIVGGGGVRNATLLRWLATELPEVRFQTHDDFGWPSDSKEAVGFAILADASIRGVPAGLPNVTGAREALVLGAIAPGRPPRVWPDWIHTV